MFENFPPFPRQPKEQGHNPLAERSKAHQKKTMITRLAPLSVFTLACLSSARGQLLLSEPVITINAGFKDEKTLFEFPYVNRSGKTLNISDISVACGCLRPEVTRKTLAAGESGKLRFTYDHGAHYGLQEVKAVVTTDDGRPAQELTARLDIPTWVDASPKLLFWADPAKPDTMVTQITVNTPEARKIKEVKVSTPGFKVEWEEVEAGRRYRIKATPEGKSRGVLSEVSFVMDPPLPPSKQPKIFLRVM